MKNSNKRVKECKARSPDVDNNYELRNTHACVNTLLVEMTLDYIACKFIPAASKECQQKKSIILQKYGVDTSYLRSSTGCV